MTAPRRTQDFRPATSSSAMGGQKIDNLPDFYKRLWSSGAPGVEVTLKVLHGSEIREVTVKSIDRAQMLRRKPTI